MTRRGIPDAVVELVLRRPHQRFLVRPGRDVYQRRFVGAAGLAETLVRAFVDFGRAPPEVVTVYQTSKIEKYWRLET